MFAFAILFTWLSVWIVFVLGLVYRREHLRKHWSRTFKFSQPPAILAFFHPYCNSGGGGERVLWTAVDVLLRTHPTLLVFIYTNDKDCLNTPSHVFQHIHHTLDIVIRDEERVQFVRLRAEPLLRANIYPFLTLAGQAFGSIIAGLECLIRLPPDFYVDTTGYSFTIPLFSWLVGARCGAYVHFPTISTDMVNRVVQHSTLTSYNNSPRIRNSNFLTTLKKFYYILFKWTYGWTGTSVNCHAVAVNSTWTLKHIEAIFGRRPILLYPPCPCLVSEKRGDQRKPWIISIGQFRPEKNHIFQLKSFEAFLKIAGGDRSSFRLILLGSCRNKEDYLRVNQLQEAAKHLGLSEQQVIFEVDPSSDTLKRYLSEATINLHTMVDEHFGICIVEGMAAGLVTVANRSGGPLMDIIGPALAQPHVDPSTVNPTPVGYLASREDEYADIFQYVLLEATPSQLEPLRAAAKRRALTLFSVEAFCKGWLQFMHKLSA
ncbi:hypothetical protein Aperf_G00000064633 [Anoplocephala perfoliata]